jgi:hypothetical protein
MSVGMHLFLAGGKVRDRDYRLCRSMPCDASKSLSSMYFKRRKRIEVKIAKCVTNKCVGAINLFIKSLIAAAVHSSCVFKLPLLRNLSATGI